MPREYYTNSVEKKKYDRTISKTDIKILSLIIISIFATAVSILSIFDYYRNLDLKMITIMRSDAIFSLLLNNIPPECFHCVDDSDSFNLKVYNSVREKLDDVRKISAVRYLYTAKLNSEGKPIYVVDGLPSSTEEFRAYGDLIEPEVTPAVSKCLEGEGYHDTDVLNTSWGIIIPACEPIKHKGATIGALVIEFDGEYFADNTAKSKKYYIIVSACVAIIVGFVTIILLRSFSTPLYKLLAYTDLLTGALNRNAFELATFKLRDTDLQAGTVALSCDLNRLKLINDQFGHAAGDERIRALAQLLMKHFKNLGTTYRTGGDEFITLAHDVSLDAMEKIVDNVCTEAQTNSANNSCLCFSYGIAKFDPSLDNSIDDTISRADGYMYLHKFAQRENDTTNRAN